jgi:hypothetical protein
MYIALTAGPAERACTSPSAVIIHQFCCLNVHLIIANIDNGCFVKSLRFFYNGDRIQKDEMGEVLRGMRVRV